MFYVDYLLDFILYFKEKILVIGGISMKKVLLISWFLNAILFYLSAIIRFTGDGNKSLGALWICLGSACLCFGASQKKDWKMIKVPSNKKQKD